MIRRHDQCLEEGVATWLRMVALHGVRIVLIDTVDKAAGWKILKVGGDDKGLLSIDQIGRLTELGRKLGVNTMWAGGLSAQQAQSLARLGVFGIYVTTAVSEAVPVSGIYERDPGLASVKSPTPDGVIGTKTLIEAGYLAGQRGSPRAENDGDLARLLKEVDDLGDDVASLTQTLPAAWNAWWQSFESEHT